MKIGICAGPEQAPAFKAAGGDYLEANVQGLLKPGDDDAAFEASRRAADDCPLPILAANCFLPGDLPSTGKDYAPAAIIDYATVAFARAKQIGIEHIVFGSGGSRGLKDDFPYDEAIDQFVDLCRQLGPIAADQAVVIVIEPLRHQECNFINTVAEGARICERIGHPSVQLLADVYHMLQNDEQAQSIVDAGAYLRHAHLAEMNDRTCPGIEGADFVPFFRAFKQAGYTGNISIEGKWPHGVELDGDKAVSILREQMAEAGIV